MRYLCQVLVYRKKEKSNFLWTWWLPTHYSSYSCLLQKNQGVHLLNWKFILSSGIKRRTNSNLTLNPMPFPPCECIPVRIYQLMLQNCKSCKQGHVRFVITIHLSRRISKLCDSSYRLNFDTKQHWHYDKAIIRLSIKVALSMTLSEQGRSKSPFL